MKPSDAEQVWSRWQLSDKRPAKGAGLYGEVPVFAPTERPHFAARRPENSHAPRG